MENLILIQLFSLFIILLIITIILLMIIPLLRKKIYKSREEYLIINNQIYTLVLLFINIIYIIFWFIGKLLLLQKIIYIILNYFFNVYILFLYITNFLLILDYYNTFTYPIYFFSYLLKIDINIQKIYEIIIFSIIAFINLVEFLCCEINYIKNKIEEYFYIDLKPSFLFECNNFKEPENSKYQNINILPFLLYFKYKGLILIIMSTLSIIYNIYLFYIIGKFNFNKSKSLIYYLIIKLLMNIVYLLYSILNTFIIEKKYDLIISFLFLLIIFIDNLIIIIKYSLSKFVQIMQNKTLIGKIGLFFTKTFDRKSKFIPLTYSTDNIQNDSSLFLIEKSSNYSLNLFEQEILLMYQNDIFVEDYYLNYLDKFLNILTSSLYKLYNSKVFSTKEINNQKLKKEMDIDVSSIKGEGISGNSDLISSTSKDEIINSENISHFILYRNKLINDFSIFEDVLNNDNIIKNNDLRIEINCYYINSCVNNIIEKNYDSKNIAKSLVSHMFIQKSNNISNSSSVSNQEIPECNYYSLTAANAKELYFKNLKSICFKTYDKKYTLEIFEINEEKNNLIINPSNKRDKYNISEIITKYFIYIESKGITNTFLPIILGIFKIKINNFKSLLILVTDNTIVENVPIKNFNNWQLIRFMQKGLKKVSSSKYTRNTIVEDDLIFKRVYWKENIKEKDCKIKLNNYEEVKNILLSDINFLKSSGCFKFNLLLMYYEYGSCIKLEPYKMNEIIKIKNNSNNKPEIINDILPKYFLYEDSMISSESEESNIIKVNNNNSKIDDRQNNIVESKTDEDSKLINETISEDNNLNISKGLNDKIIKYSDEINFNGYSGIFDNHNCLCFFTFENVLENKKNYQYNYDFYKNYLKKIMKYFTPLKEKENTKENIDKKISN